MSTELLSGKKLATELREEVAASIDQLKAKGIQPKLAVVVATDDGGTDFYVRHIVKAGEAVGMNVHIARLSSDATQDNIAAMLTELANDSAVHGIILQTPLPEGAHAVELRGLIPPEKDVDGANPLSAGRLMSGVAAFAPSTAVAVMEILKRYDISVQGTRAVIVGRSLVVGKPLAHLLLEADATVTICHSKTRDLSAITQTADILIAAVGQPHMVTAVFIKPGAIVIDVGTTASDDGLVGDVDHKSMQGKAGALSPVPGGVGPVTTAILLKHSLLAAQATLA